MSRGGHGAPDATLAVRARDPAADPCDASQNSLPRWIAVVGPTAAGKSRVGLALARALDRVIWTCDSVQVHRGLDIGSAKPSLAIRAGHPHALLDLVDPDEPFSAHDWATACWTRAARERGLIVGGTGFYLRSAAWTATDYGDADDAEDADGARARFEAHWSAAESTEPGAIHRALMRVDPETANAIHVHNQRRALRALWLCERLGRPLSAARAADPPRRRVDLLLIEVDPGPEAVDAAIRARCASMIAAGWIGEVEALLNAGYDPAGPGLRSLGYREVVEHLAGRLTKDALPASIAEATCRYARRQRTYLRTQFPGCEKILWPDPSAPIEPLLTQIDAHIHGHAPSPTDTPCAHPSAT